MSRTDSYVDDIPMRLSRMFEPFFFESSSSLPEVRTHESLMREFTYEFNTELCALEVADRRSKEICDEAERVRQLQLKMMTQQPPPPQPVVSAAWTPKTLTQPPIVPLIPAPNSIHPHHHQPMPKPFEGQPQQIDHKSTQPLHQPQPQQSHQTQDSQQSHGGQSRHQPQNHHQVQPISTKEFEDFVVSSPFDDALLRSIDDRQELNSVFANVQPASNSLNNSQTNGPSHSGYNHFTPR